MANTSRPQIHYPVFQHQDNPENTQSAQGKVRQDKRATVSARSASPQPARFSLPLRAKPEKTPPPRAQNAPVHQKRTVQLTLWVSPIEKTEIQRRAAREHLSVSSVGAALLRKGLQTDLDLHYGALLEPVFTALFDRRMSARDNRLALLLVRIAFAVEQTRSLTTNILGRQPGIKPDVLNTILDRSAEDAKRKITRRSPQLAELIREIKRDLEPNGKDKTHA
jgi:hypothetical protein